MNYSQVRGRCQFLFLKPKVRGNMLEYELIVKHVIIITRGWDNARNHDNGRFN